jgi:predicted dehydrogenase
VFGNKGWVQVVDKTHPQAPEGWVVTKALHGGKPQTVEYPVVSLVRANLEAFADAAAGRAPYPITTQDMIDNIAAFEAIGRSAESGQVVQVVGVAPLPVAKAS